MKLKKGFLNDSKGELYGPGGSEQAKAAPSDTDMLKEFGHLLGNTTDDPAKRAEVERLTKDLLAYKDKEKADATAQKSAKPKATALPPPEYTVEQGPDGTSLLLSVNVPGLESMQGVSLDVAEKSASLVFPVAANLGTLKAALPEAVVPSQARAKFSRKTQRITVTVPLVAAASA